MEVSLSVCLQVRILFLWQLHGVSLMLLLFTKWTTSFCQIPFLSEPFGLLPACSYDWLNKEQVGHFLGLLPHDEKVFLKTLIIDIVFLIKF